MAAYTLPRTSLWLHPKAKPLQPAPLPAQWQVIGQDVYDNQYN